MSSAAVVVGALRVRRWGSMQEIAACRRLNTRLHEGVIEYSPLHVRMFFLCMYVLNVVTIKKTTYLLRRAFPHPLSDLASVDAIKQTGSEKGLFLPAFTRFSFSKANIENHNGRKTTFLLHVRPFVVVLFEEKYRSTSWLESFTFICYLVSYTLFGKVF